MKVLFVSHDGSRTGAPMLLLWLVRWLKQHSQISPVVEAVCPTHFWQPPPPYRPWLPRLLDRFDKTRNSSAATLLANTIMSCEPDVVYLNTLVLGRYLNDLGERARDRVFRQSSIDVAAPMIVSTLQQVMEGRSHG